MPGALLRLPLATRAPESRRWDVGYAVGGSGLWGKGAGGFTWMVAVSMAAVVLLIPVPFSIAASPQASADASLYSRCFRRVYRFLTDHDPPGLADRASGDVLALLAGKHDEWLAQRKADSGKARIPDGFSDPVLLGEGGEGTVFLAWRDGRPEVLKVFRRKAGMASNLRRMKKLRESGLPVPEIVEVNEAARYVRFGYIKGFSVEDLVSGREGGLSRRQRREIQGRYESFVEDASRALPVGWRPSPRNTVLDLDHDRFVIIDPI